MGVTRRAKIVCTLGPATATPERIRGLVDAGMDVARLNFSHGSHADHEQVLPPGPGGRRGGRPGRRHPGRPAGPEDPARPVRRRPGRVAHRRHRRASPATTSSAPPTGSRCTYREAAGGGQARRPAAHRRRQGRRRGHRGRRATTSACLVIEGGPVSNNKGVSLPNVAVSVPALSEKDVDDLRFALRLGVDLVALSFVRSPDDIKLVHEIMDEVGHPPPGARQDREAGGGRRARGDRRRVRRRHGGPRRPRRGAAARPGAAGAEARRAAVPRAGQAGHRGHPDARLDDRELPADPRRGVRRRQRGARRRRRGDALRRDQRRASTRCSPCQHDGPDHRDHRGRLDRRAAAAARPADPRRRASPWRRRSIARAIGAKALVAFSQTGDTVRRLARLHCELPLLAFTPVPAVRDQLALSWGVETFLVPFVRAHRRHVPPGRPGAARPRPGRAAATTSWSSPAARPARPGSTNTLRVHQLGSLVDPATVTASDRRRGRPGGGRPAARGCSTSSRSTRRPFRGHEPAGRPAAGLRRPGRRRRRWSPPAAPSTRPGTCTRCTATSCARATRPSRSSTAVENIRDGRSFSVRRSVAVPARQADLLHVGVVPPAEEGPRPPRAGAGRRAAARTRCPTMAERLAPYPERLGDLDADAAADRRAVRRRARLGAGPATGAADAAPAGVDAHRRQAARRPAAARLRADVRLRPDPARLGAVACTARSGGPAAWSAPASTTRCGSTGRSGPTSGSSTTAGARRRPARAAWPPAGCSPTTAGTSPPPSRRACCAASADSLVACAVRFMAWMSGLDRPIG